MIQYRINRLLAAATLMAIGFGVPYAMADLPLVIEGKARFTPITPTCIRMEYNSKGAFVNDPSYFAVNRKAVFSDVKVTEAGGAYTLETPVIKVIYKPDGKSFHAGNLQTQIKKGSQDVTWRPGDANDGNLGGSTPTFDRWGEPRKLPEGVLSRNGWYLIDDSKGALLVNNWAQPRPADTETDWYFFGYGNDYAAAMKSLTTISGSIPLPRKYMLGMYYSRFWPYNTSDYRQIVEEYDQKGFPLDVLVLDMDWHTPIGWTGYTWNRTLFPDAEDFIKWLHSRQIAVTLNDHPIDGVKAADECYEPFAKAMGLDPTSKKTVPFDPGNEKYMREFYSYTHAPFDKSGVDFWWLDWQQYPFVKNIPSLTTLGWLNRYFYQESENDGKRGASLSRWGGWGDHRHPIHFSGDATVSFRMLAFQVPFTATSSNSGCFFWSHDIGGHTGARNEEAYARWSQFGAFSAAYRPHSSRNPTANRLPWTYEQWAQDSLRISARLRAEMMPYTYSSVRESCQESVPLIRPVYFDRPENDVAYQQPQEYQYGDHCLVAPVVKPSVGERMLGTQTVWFPEGTWFNYFSGEKYAGGTDTIVAATINEFPLYLRGGVPIPMRNYTSRVTAPLYELVVRCYPGEDGNRQSFNLYEDDGITRTYQNGAFAETSLSYERKGNSVDVRIAPAKGAYEGQVKERSYVIELPCTQRAGKVLVNGTAAQSEYSESEKINRIKVPATSILKSIDVHIEVADADQAVIRAVAFANRTGLPTPAAGQTVDTLLPKAVDAAKSPEEIEAVLAAAGTGIVSKNVGLYGFPLMNRTVQFYGLAEPLKTRGVAVDSDLSGEKVRSGCLMQYTLPLHGKEIKLMTPDVARGMQIAGNIAPNAKITTSDKNEQVAALTDGLITDFADQKERVESVKVRKAKDVGVWVQLTWAEPHMIDKVVLFAKPDRAAFVYGGKLEFSDGTSVEFPGLDGTAEWGRALSFTPRSATSVKVLVTKSAKMTKSLAISEIAVIESTRAPAAQEPAVKNKKKK